MEFSEDAIHESAAANKSRYLIDGLTRGSGGHFSFVQEMRGATLLLGASCFAARGIAESAAGGIIKSYFGGAENEDYLVWARSVGHSASVFLPSSTDPADGAAVHWTIDEPYVEIGVAVRASGWVGFGISEHGGMKGADMFLLEAETADALGIRDLHVDDKRVPYEDGCQDWQLVDYKAKGGFLVVETRP